MKDTAKTALDRYTGYISSLEEVLQIYLFGSHAWGEPDEGSDIDLLVVVDDNIKALKTAVKIQMGLAKQKIVPLDVMVNNRTTFIEATNGITLQKHIKDEGVLLYERQ